MLAVHWTVTTEDLTIIWVLTVKTDKGTWAFLFIGNGTRPVAKEGRLLTKELDHFVNCKYYTPTFEFCDKCAISIVYVIGSLEPVTFELAM